jgi:hypothetical protein
MYYGRKAINPPLLFLTRLFSFGPRTELDRLLLYVYQRRLISGVADATDFLNHKFVRALKGPANFIPVRYAACDLKMMRSNFCG